MDDLHAETGGIAAEQPDGDEVAAPAEPDEKGEQIAVFSANITLYDPRSWDVSRANRPIVPEAPTAEALSAAIEGVIAEMGYAVNARVTRTDK